MTHEFEAGDVVELKSGGPRMTIGSIADGQALCSWFVEGKPNRSRYAITALRLAPESLASSEPDAV